MFVLGTGKLYAVHSCNPFVISNIIYYLYGRVHFDKVTLVVNIVIHFQLLFIYMLAGHPKGQL
jgi:cellulose synthase/poly-beta-1,6-N-acetylglucosamine synthase-like glycosyltransferase